MGFVQWGRVIILPGYWEGAGVILVCFLPSVTEGKNFLVQFQSLQLSFSDFPKIWWWILERTALYIGQIWDFFFKNSLGSSNRLYYARYFQFLWIKILFLGHFFGFYHASYIQFFLIIKIQFLVNFSVLSTFQFEFHKTWNWVV